MSLITTNWLPTSTVGINHSCDLTLGHIHRPYVASYPSLPVFFVSGKNFRVKRWQTWEGLGTRLDHMRCVHAPTLDRHTSVTMHYMWLEESDWKKSGMATLSDPCNSKTVSDEPTNDKKSAQQADNCLYVGKSFSSFSEFQHALNELKKGGNHPFEFLIVKLGRIRGLQ